MEQETIEIRNEGVRKNRVRWDTIVVSILSILGVILLFIDGLFKYNYYIESIYTTSHTISASFIDLIIRADMWQLYPIIICASLIVILISVWVYAFRKPTKWLVVGIISSAISLGTFVVGTIAGINSFDWVHTHRSPFGIGMETEKAYFDRLDILFYVEIAILIIILILIIVKKCKMGNAKKE